MLTWQQEQERAPERTGRWLRSMNAVTTFPTRKNNWRHGVAIRWHCVRSTRTYNTRCSLMFTSQDVNCGRDERRSTRNSESGSRGKLNPFPTKKPHHFAPTKFEWAHGSPSCALLASASEWSLRSHVFQDDQRTKVLFDFDPGETLVHHGGSQPQAPSLQTAAVVLLLVTGAPTQSVRLPPQIVPGFVCVFSASKTRTCPECGPGRTHTLCVDRNTSHVFSHTPCTCDYTHIVAQGVSYSIHMPSTMSHVWACDVCPRFVSLLFISHLHLFSFTVYLFAVPHINFNNVVTAEGYNHCTHAQWGVLLRGDTQPPHTVEEFELLSRLHCVTEVAAWLGLWCLRSTSRWAGDFHPRPAFAANRGTGDRWTAPQDTEGSPRRKYRSCQASQTPQNRVPHWSRVPGRQGSRGSRHRGHVYSRSWNMGVEWTLLAGGRLILARTVMEWWQFGRGLGIPLPSLWCQPDGSPAVQALTRVWCLRHVAVSRLLRPAWWTICRTLKFVLSWNRRRQRALIDRQGEDLWAPRQTHHHCCAGRFHWASVVPASFIVKETCGFHDVWRWHPQGLVRLVPPYQGCIFLLFETPRSVSWRHTHWTSLVWDSFPWGVHRIRVILKAPRTIVGQMFDAIDNTAASMNWWTSDIFHWTHPFRFSTFQRQCHALRWHDQVFEGLWVRDAPSMMRSKVVASPERESTWFGVFSQLTAHVDLEGRVRWFLALECPQFVLCLPSAVASVENLLQQSALPIFPLFFSTYWRWCLLVFFFIFLVALNTLYFLLSPCCQKKKTSPPPPCGTPAASHLTMATVTKSTPLHASAWKSRASSPPALTRAFITGCFRCTRARAPGKLTRGLWNSAPRKLTTPRCWRVCWLGSPTAVLRWTQPPLTPPAAPWARPLAATKRSMPSFTLLLIPVTTPLRPRFLASSLALTSSPPTSSPPPSVPRTPPWTFRSVHRM